MRPPEPEQELQDGAQEPSRRFDKSLTVLDSFETKVWFECTQGARVPLDTEPFPKRDCAPLQLPRATSFLGLPCHWSWAGHLTFCSSQSLLAACSIFSGCPSTISRKALLASGLNIHCSCIPCCFPWNLQFILGRGFRSLP